MDKEVNKMTRLLKTLVLISLLASVSTYACEWKNKSKAQKTMAQITIEQAKNYTPNYASSWSEARNSKLLEFPATTPKVIKSELNSGTKIESVSIN